MKEKNKTYTTSDFARYHAGTMPAGEMHDMEKAALEDPFLEDALAGYVNAPAAESDIRELRVRLAEKQKRKNVFFLSPGSQNIWWRIAALFIIMSGAGYLFYRENYVKEKNLPATTAIKTSAIKADSAAYNKTDSATAKNDIAFENQSASKSAKKEKVTLPAARLRSKKS